MGCVSSAHAKRRILYDNSLVGLKSACFLESRQIGIGRWLSTLYIIGSSDVFFIDESTEIPFKTLYQWQLSAACNDAALDACSMYLLHEVEDTWHEWCLRETMENVTLLIIHTLCLSLVDLTTLLLEYHETDGIYPTRSLSGIGIVGCHVDSGIGIVGCHVDAELSHALLPGNGMIGHGVIEDAVHIEKHGFGAECLKAVFF